jgi:hypothetical protein
MARTRTPQFKSLREAILHVLAQTSDDVKVKDVAEAALKLHPVAGKTPEATASAQIYTLAKAGLIRKAGRGLVSGTKPITRASTRRKAASA